MLRFIFATVIGLIVLRQSVLQADDEKKPKSTEKPAVKQVQKKQPLLLQKADKTNQTQKMKPAVATLGSDVEYYTTSPAQGRPADGKLPAGTKVKVIEKAGSYVRVMAVIEAYVPADSLKAVEGQDSGKEKPTVDKAALKKKAAAEKDPAAEKKKAAIDKAALKKKAAAEDDAAAAKKKALIEKKKAAAEDDAAAAKKKAALSKEIEKKEAAKKQDE